MNVSSIAETFKERMCASVELETSGLDRWIVETPFLLPGGDHVPVILEPSPRGWRLTDDGETFMQLALLLPNYNQGSNRRKIIEAALAAHRVENRDGTLVLDVTDERYADSLTSFIQAVLEVMDVRHWTHEVVRETFRQDAQQFVTALRPDVRFDYHDLDHDPEGHYEVDALVTAAKDVVVMFVGNDDQCRDATIVLHQWEKWGRQFESAVLFRDEEQITRRPRAQLGDIAGKSFSSLSAARERFPKWLEERTA